jgi:hypothetical protein
MLAFTLEQLALSKYERDKRILLERRPRYTRGSTRVEFDAVYQDREGDEDIVVEVRWLRKRYFDAPIWVRQVDAAKSAYELVTGRKAKGVLILIVPKDNMGAVNDLPYTAAELAKVDHTPEVAIYTYAELGFDPGPLSAGVIGL